jgi:hypothetical protein
MAGFNKPGRKIKREFPRTETLKIRISKEHLELLDEMQDLWNKENNTTIHSKSDIVERALVSYGITLGISIEKW